MEEDEQITLSLGQLFASKNKKRREYRCRFVKAGRIRRAGNSPSNIVIEALSTASGGDGSQVRCASGIY